MLIGPGQTQLTVTPVRPSSTARLFVRPITPCLLAVYAVRPAVAMRPSVEAMLTTRPAPDATRWGRAARIIRAWAVRFTSNVAAHASSKSASERAGAGQP